MACSIPRGRMQYFVILYPLLLSFAWMILAQPVNVTVGSTSSDILYEPASAWRLWTRTNPRVNNYNFTHQRTSLDGAYAYFEFVGEDIAQIIRGV